MKNRLYLVCGGLVVAAAGGLLSRSPWVPREPVLPAFVICRVREP